MSVSACPVALENTLFSVFQVGCESWIFYVTKEAKPALKIYSKFKMIYVLKKKNLCLI